MNEFVLNMVRMIVDHPDDVQLTGLQGDTTLVYELRCHREDVGKVIGKEGKTVGAMRTLLGAMASRKGRRVVLEVIE
jgi:uncharacterized protein